MNRSLRPISEAIEFLDAPMANKGNASVHRRESAFKKGYKFEAVQVDDVEEIEMDSGATPQVEYVDAPLMTEIAD